MGFWGTLAKIGKVALPVAATVMTGGAAAPLAGKALAGTLIGAAGSALAGGADAAASNREAKTQNLMVRDQLGMQGARDFENQQQYRAELQMKQLEAQRALEADAYRKALKSALALNMKDAAFDRPSNVPTLRFSGGSRPSALGAEGAQAARLMNNKSLQALMSEDQGVNAKMSAPEKYKMADMPEQSIWEKLAGPAGLAMTAAGKVMDARNAAARAGEGARVIEAAPLSVSSVASRIYRPEMLPQTPAPRLSVPADFMLKEGRF